MLLPRAASLCILLLVIVFVRAPRRTAAYKVFNACDERVKPDPSLVQPYNLTELRNGQSMNRQFSLSTVSPVAAQLRMSSAAMVHVGNVLNLLRNLSDVMDRRNARNDSLACNLRRARRWISASLTDVEVRQVASFEDFCNSVLFGNDLMANNNAANSSVRTLVKAAVGTITAANVALFRAMNNIEERPDPAVLSLNWTTKRAFEVRGGNVRQQSQRCTVHSAFAYRRDGEWYIRATMTNKDPKRFLPDHERQTIDEFVHESFDYSLASNHPSYCNPDLLEKSTTLLTRSAQRLGLSMVYPMGYKDNPAITKAMRDNEILVDLAEDSLTVSNIAILALPMVMSLIPVAFLADLNTCATLWYIIFTDVFSALPFLVKGVELIQTARKRDPHVVVYQMGNTTAGQVEIWASDCSGQETFRTLGIIFVLLAILATTVGVGIEMWANMYMKQKREDQGQAADGPFGHAIFNVTTESLLGGHGFDESDDGVALEEAKHRISDVAVTSAGNAAQRDGFDPTDVADVKYDGYRVWTL